MYENSSTRPNDRAGHAISDGDGRAATHVPNLCRAAPVRLLALLANDLVDCERLHGAGRVAPVAVAERALERDWAQLQRTASRLARRITIDRDLRCDLVQDDGLRCGSWT